MSGVAEDRDSGDPAPIPLTRSESFVGDLPSHDEILARKKSVGNIIESPSKASAPISLGRNGSIGQLLGGNSGELGQTSASNSVAGSAAGGGRMRQIRGATQLLYSELLNRPGGPWAWYEKDNGKEKALPKCGSPRIPAQSSCTCYANVFKRDGQNYHEKGHDRPSLGVGHWAYGNGITALA